VIWSMAMAVISGSSDGLFWSWRSSEQIASDRLLALQSQEGLAEDWQPDSGVVVKRLIGLSEVVVDVAVDVYIDGVTNGTNVLSSASAPFRPEMVGLAITVSGLGRRVIELVVSSSAVELSGPPMTAASGRHFTAPLGTAAFLDGVTYGDQRLTSVSAPFSASSVGRRTSIDDQGTRVITSFTSPSEVEVDGPPLPAAASRRFTLPVFSDPVDRGLETGGGAVIESRRTPSAISPTILRWRIGGR